MTDIEQKALALLNEVAKEMGLVKLRVLDTDLLGERALCRAIEQHEAYKQEVSDAVVAHKQAYGIEEREVTYARLSRFIIPKPVDPLVFEAREICARVCEGWVDIPEDRAAAYRDGMHDDEADFAYALNALRKANEKPEGGAA